MSEHEALVLVNDQEGVRTLTLNRPHRRNALNSELVRVLKEHLEQASDDDTVHVIVLKGAGKAFCAGGDLSPGGLANPERMQQDRLDYVALLESFRTVGKPTVAQVHGKALGGGFGIALACDLAIGAASARMGTPEVRVGLFPMMIMPLILRHLGRKRTLELILTGGDLDAAEALEAGCLNRVVADEDLEGAVQELVSKLRSFSPSVHRLGLEHFHKMDDMSLSDGFVLGADGLGQNLMLEDAAIGLSSFLMKKKPEWKGK
jgi:enoyl-CoA hydratase/carnithine racemase